MKTGVKKVVNGKTDAYAIKNIFTPLAVMNILDIAPSAMINLGMELVSN